MRVSDLIALQVGAGFELADYGLALDTVVTTALNPGAGPTSFTVTASGDTLTVRNFALTDYAALIGLGRRGATSGFFRVRSPLLHDNVRGIMVTTGETPSLLTMPAEVAQRLTAQDTLIAEGSGGAAETDLGILAIYYSNLAGMAARLHSMGDISGIIKSIKPLTVAVTSSATIGAWTDTVITTTEDLLHANTDYAVLGYVTNVALGWVAIKGIDVGNLRPGGPGTINAEDSSNFFVWQAFRHNLPLIPVINSANKGGTFVSVVDSAASTAATITLYLAELSQNLPN